VRTAARRGFTLLELMVVLALLAITSAAAVPALLGARAIPPGRRTAMELQALLSEARDASRESGIPAAFVLAPAEGRYWMTRGDSTLAGMIAPPAGARIESTSDRIVCRFAPAAHADPCTIVVRGETTDTVRVDPWDGEIRIVQVGR
jgi:prepilin-type N-terminal cleavage/methylation domain-containing protein